MTCKRLNEKDTQFALTLNKKTITGSELVKMFGVFTPGGEPKFRTNDTFIIPKNTMKYDYDIMTTIGIWIINQYLFEGPIRKVIGYINETIDGKRLEDIETTIASALKDDLILPDDYADYLDYLQHLAGGKLNTVITPSLTPGILKPVKSVMDRKKFLLDKYKKEIAAGNAIVGAQIENELVAMAKNELKDDPGMENFYSNSKASFENNYKNMEIMKGSVSASDGSFSIATSNYDEGISREDFAALADSAVKPAYSKGVGTQVGGYLVKKFNANFQDCAAAEDGSDCKTTEYLRIMIPPRYASLYIGRFIKEGNSLVEITPTNLSKYSGKMVLMRSVMFCHHKAPKSCSKCVGTDPYKLGITEYGLAISRAPSSILNASLKSIHDSRVKLTKVDPSKLFTWVIKEKDISGEDVV